jgi:hypothetical protein
VEEIQQIGDRRGQEEIIAEESNGNRRREEYNNRKYHEAAYIKRGPKTVCDSNQDGLGEIVTRRNFQSYLS